MAGTHAFCASRMLRTGSRVSKSMAWKLIALGQLQSVRIGRAVRVRPADLEAYLERAVREG